MENSKPEEEKAIKDIEFFLDKKELIYTAIRDIRNLFRLGKEAKTIKDRVLRDIMNLFEHEEENHYEPVRVSNVWSNKMKVTAIDRNKTLTVEEYLNKISPYLKDIITNLKNSDTWEIQLTIANSFTSSIDYDEQHVIHSESDYIVIMINDKAVEVIKELFDSLKNRYQSNLESMEKSQFVFDYVSLYYNDLFI